MENESGILIQPVYVVCDESSSMSDDGILAVNAGIEELFTVVANDPVVDAKLRLGLIFFDDKAEVILSLSQCSNLDNVLGCVRSDNPSSFASVFRALKSQIQIDVPRLKSDGFRVSRPIVLLISGSVPTDHVEWGDAYSELIDQNFRFHPNIICLGLEGANLALLTNVATKTSSVDPLGERFVFKVQEFPSKKEVGEFVSRLFLLAARLGSVVDSEDQKRSINIGSLGEIDGISQLFISDSHIEELVLERESEELVVAPWEVVDNESGAQALPLYFVCDEGSSMTDDAIDAVNVGIGEMVRTIQGDPVVDSKAHVSVIIFSNVAEVVLPLSHLSNVSQIPGCVRSINPSSFKNVFRLLKSQIEMDYVRLQGHGFNVRRPYVFFMTVGKPGPEDWHDSLKQLTDLKFRYRPNIVTFGMPGADLAVIKEVSTPLKHGAGRKDSFVFLLERGVNAGDALREIIKSTVDDDMIYSARTAPTVSFVIDTGSVGEPVIDSI